MKVQWACHEGAVNAQLVRRQQPEASGNLTVEGKNSQTFYAAKDVSSSNKSVESRSSVLGGAISLDNKTTTDQLVRAKAVATQLESTKLKGIRRNARSIYS